MNGPGDIPLTLSTTPDTRPCSLVSIIPTLGMSSCRGRAEAFARRLSSKLRTLGSQNDDDEEVISQEEDEPIINGGSANTWITSHQTEQTVTDLQPLPHESDSFFDFDCELESPGSPAEECEYLRLIESASNTPHNSAAESGYACASAASSHSSSGGPPYFGEDTVDAAAASPLHKETQSSLSSTAELPEFLGALVLNGSGSDSSDRLSNGTAEGLHTESGEEETRESEDKSTAIAQLNHATKIADALPTTGPDVIAETATEAEMSASCMAKIQDQIISELQKQSKAVSVNTERRESETAELPAASKDILHNITNRHLTNGKEVLEIELTEIEQANENTSGSIGPNEEKTPELADETIAPSIQLAPCDENENEVTEKTQQHNQHHAHLSTADTTDDEDDCRPQRVRRCSSLKTGKTPPGTPGRKKIVRFADVLGLDLADVKTFLDEIPTIPKSAFEDLEIMESEPPMQLGPKSDKMLMPLFQQPGGLPTFLDLVREKQVSLENAAVTDHINQTITGSVRVRNLDFHKSVHIRYTLDGWRSYADLQANYVENSCDGFSDIFTFVLFGNSLHIGQRLEFAVRFQCKGQQFWDNNYGTNYCFQCLPASGPVTNPIQPIVTPSTHHTDNMVPLLSPGAGDAWCSSFY